jgi:putative ABC transport system substrate-binding protein
MKRREFITLLGGAAAWPLMAQAQSSVATKRVSILEGLAKTDAEGQARIAAFIQGLRQLGWNDGVNIQLEYHWDVSGNTLSRELAAEVVGNNPDVIVTNSPTGLAAVKQATNVIPIVFAQVADPVDDGFVVSLAHPGGNITGFAISEHTMSTKWLQILKEIAPRTKRVGFIQHVEHPSWPRYNRVIQDVAPTIGFVTFPIGVRNATELEDGINNFSQQSDGALLILADTFTSANRKIIIDLARQHSLPAVYAAKFFPKEGGLISYGGDVVDLLRRAALYVDRILRGDKAGDLPVQQATKFELIVNLKTAKELGLAVPETLLARADEVIE